MLYADFSDRIPPTARIYWLADTHIGREGLCLKGLKSIISRIARDENAYVGLGGDMIEAIHLGDKRFDVDIHAGKHRTASAQINFSVKLFEPIKEKILFLLEGNHEYRIRDTYNFCYEFANKLKIDIPLGKPISPDSEEGIGNINIVARLSPQVKWYAHHGGPSVTSWAYDREQMMNNEGLRIKKILSPQRGDCVLMSMAHIHKMRIVKPTETLAIVGNKDNPIIQTYPSRLQDSETGYIPPDNRWYFSTGAFFGNVLLGKDTYGARRMYRPLQLGCIKIYLEDGYVKDIQKVIIGS